MKHNTTKKEKCCKKIVKLVQMLQFVCDKKKKKYTYTWTLWGRDRKKKKSCMQLWQPFVWLSEHKSLHFAQLTFCNCHPTSCCGGGHAFQMPLTHRQRQTHTFTASACFKNYTEVVHWFSVLRRCEACTNECFCVTNLIWKQVSVTLEANINLFN